MRSWSRGEIPGPVSATRTANSPLDAATAIATAPVSVNLIALPTRFSSTCVIRRSSPWPVGRSGGTEVVNARCFSRASASTAVATPRTTSAME
jgi:hypothetical protein